MYCYVWSYVVRPEHLLAFQIAYGPDGDWCQFFRRDPEYIRTNFLGDLDNPTRFMTIDFWTSREACLSFRERFGSEFEALDKNFGQLTVEEVYLGDFEVLDEPNSPGRSESRHVGKHSNFP
jgi:hypothetical protein